MRLQHVDLGNTVQHLAEVTGQKSTTWVSGNVLGAPGHLGISRREEVAQAPGRGQG